MKIINSRVFQVVYYCIYLFQEKINGRIADFIALRILSCFFSLFLSVVLIIACSLIYRGWIGYIFPLVIYFYIDHLLFKKVYDTGLTKKIINNKPKILDSNILSVIVIVLIILSGLLALWGAKELTLLIEARGIHLIK